MTQHPEVNSRRVFTDAGHGTYVMTESEASLSQVHRSVSIPKGASLSKRMFASFGPARMVRTNDIGALSLGLSSVLPK